MKFPIMKSSPVPCSHTYSICVLPLVRETNFHTHMKQQVTVLYILFKFLERRQEDKRLYDIQNEFPWDFAQLSHTDGSHYG